VFAAGLSDGLEQRHLLLRDWVKANPHAPGGGDLNLQPLFEFAREASASTVAPEHVRVAAIRVLCQADTRTAGNVLLDLLSPEQSGAVQSAAAQALIKLNDAALANRLFAHWSRYTRHSRQAVLSATPSSAVFATALLDALEQRQISLLEINASTAQALQKSATPELRPRAQALFAGSTNSDRNEVLRRFQPALQVAGERRHGAEIFAKTCLICHAIKGQGSQVGPDLSAAGTRPRETLLVDILDPTRSVSPDFISYTLETADGRTLTGLIASETAVNVTLRRAQQPDETVPRSLIKDLRADGKSLMPDGLEQGLSVGDFADLLAFLKDPETALIPKN
jgi:putative heme-binding domain-containing protein